jgi:tRNA (mo5U34)-methyltransferase
MTEPTADNPALRAELESVIDEQRDAFHASGWWHSIDLGAGRVTPGVHPLAELQRNYREFHLPDDLTGKRLLDIGCWDGFYSFEAERHGAQVTSVDVWCPQTYFQAHAALQSQAVFHEKSVYELKREDLGGHDIVLFLGVLYHLKHPLLALERVCELTNDFAIIETHAVDNLFDTSRPVMEFYEIDQLGGQYDNWWGPNSECVMQLARAAGFVRTEAIRLDPTRAVVKAYRRWLPWDNLEAHPALRIRRVINACTDDERFPRRGRHAYLALMVEGLPRDAQRETLQFEIGGLGSFAVYLGASKFAEDANALQVTVPIPLGLPVGNTILRMRYGNAWAADWELKLSEGNEW